MRSEKLYDAFNYIDDWYLDIADSPAKENIIMKQTHFSARKMVVYIVAAAICVSLLAATAVAAGWIPNIFAAVEPVRKEDAAILEAALEATIDQTIETVSVPDVDFTQFTLYERFYDGESILLGYDLSKIMPEIVVGFQPDTELLTQIKSVPCWKQACPPEQKHDILEENYALGYITEEVYREVMESRTENGMRYGLKKYWQIIMDCKMKETLTTEQYEQFWNILLEEGACCVAIPSEPWVGDRITVNGKDFSEFIGPGLPGNFRTDYTTDEGDCIVLDPIPETTRNLDSVEVELKLKSGWHYWYMELDGDVYDHYVQNPVHTAVFTLKNTNN